jgi:hypothetical protein
VPAALPCASVAAPAIFVCPANEVNRSWARRAVREACARVGRGETLPDRGLQLAQKPLVTPQRQLGPQRRHPRQQAPQLVRRAHRAAVHPGLERLQFRARMLGG